MGLMSEEERLLLEEKIQKLPLVDAHAHPLVPIHSSFPFLRCFSEAQDVALLDVPHTLSFKRSIRDLAQLYQCDASLKSIQEYRTFQGIGSICKRCFEASNISSILIDDGITFDQMFDFEWHRKYVTNVYRVLRIETVAEDILNEDPPGGFTWDLDSFAKRFVARLKSLSADNVIAFKSIAAYRSGLDIDPLVSNQAAEEGLYQNLHSSGPLRINNKNLIDFIFVRGLEVATSCGIPMQIHTGFGDKDLDLRLANPLHLRSVLEDKRFANCRLVLLHAAYPYSKELSHLASVYPQVYIDFGLAIPKLSIHGMQTTLSELLELAPLNKVMFSTDGYAFPETYFLGAKWARRVVMHVISKACDEGDLSVEDAFQIADGIFACNASKLYGIEHEARTNISNSMIGRNIVNNSALEPHKNDPSVKYVRLLWADGSGQRRCRVLPSARFENIICKHGLGLTKACMGMPSYTDSPAEDSGLGPSGEIRLVPDLTTQRKLPWCLEQKLVLTDMHLFPGSPWEYCPRTTLRRMSDILQNEFGLTMNAGFENEFYILKPNPGSGRRWIGLDSTSYCSSASFDAAASILTDICNALDAMEVPVDQLHAESGGGQFEIALGYSSCMNSADNLLLLRETVKAIVKNHGLLATFLPKCFPNDAGSGSHVHLSLSQGGRNVFMAEAGSKTRYGISRIGEEFMAGVLYHLPSILAFTAPLPNSYDRIRPNTWSGAFQCWGKENREAPIRTACPPGTAVDFISNFEVKSFDGCTNPHLGLAAILAAGIDGLRKQLPLPEPIDVNPATLEEGLVPKMPATLDQALTDLQENEVMKAFLGVELLKAIIAIRQSEINFYKKEKDVFDMLISRY